MSSKFAHQQAIILMNRAYRQQMHGQIGDAIELYERSIAMHPTAEAHTYLGWTYSMIGRLGEAIEQCEEAIAIDPSFGNPYNDIGAYLIEQGKWEESVRWFEQALNAEKYDVPQFALMNLGRVAEYFGRYQDALKHYDEALTIDPIYRSALNAKYTLLGHLN